MSLERPVRSKDLAWSKPLAADASATVGPGPANIRIVMNYRHGLFSLRPLGD